MMALMEATGLEKGGIYRHFRSKEELAIEAFDYASQETMRRRLIELEKCPDSVDKLKALISSFITRTAAIPGGCPLFNAAVDADDGNPLLRDRAKKAIRRWVKALETTIRKGIDAKEIRPEVKPRQLAVLLISTLEGALVLSRLEKNNEPMMAVRAHLEHHLEAAVRIPGKAKQ